MGTRPKPGEAAPRLKGVTTVGTRESLADFRGRKAASALAGMADRVTFVIDEKGRIAHVIDRPDVASHAGEVLALL